MPAFGSTVVLFIKKLNHSRQQKTLENQTGARSVFLNIMKYRAGLKVWRFCPRIKKAIKQVG